MLDKSKPMFSWTVHGDGRTVAPNAAVAPDERLHWPQTIGIGVQHVMAMFGATVLVPALTGFPVTTTLLFSGLGTIIFLLVTGNRIPSYLGSSFASSPRSALRWARAAITSVPRSAACS